MTHILSTCLDCWCHVFCLQMYHVTSSWKTHLYCFLEWFFLCLCAFPVATGYTATAKHFLVQEPGVRLGQAFVDSCGSGHYTASPSHIWSHLIRFIPVMKDNNAMYFDSETRSAQFGCSTCIKAHTKVKSWFLLKDMCDRLLQGLLAW